MNHVTPIYALTATTLPPDPIPAFPSPSHPHILAAYTHATQTTVDVYMHDYLTDRPRTTTGLQTLHKHTYPAVKVREMSTYCRST